MKTLLFNADVGEGYDDARIMPHLHAANIACGAHAGDTAIMRHTLALAKQHGVIAGAHPGYPDRVNFGRKTLDIPPKSLDDSIATQIANLAALASADIMRLAYVKPHGALNHDMLINPDLFARLCSITASADCNPVLMVPINAQHEMQNRIAHEHGITIWWEVFADRTYEANGLLRARHHPDAMHHDPIHILAQIMRIEAHREIIAIDGSILDMSMAHTICIHGDHPPSVAAITRRVRS